VCVCVLGSVSAGQVAPLHRVSLTKPAAPWGLRLQVPEAGPCAGRQGP
jgi:hypothetical protein